MYARLRKSLLVGCMTMLFAGTALAQDAEFLLWEDNFNDMNIDTLGLVNVGWIRFTPEQGLVGSTVAQRDSSLYLQAGTFGGVVGAVIAETNGLPVFNPFDTTTTRALLIQNNFSSPNHVATFRFNLEKIGSSLFIYGARLKQDSITTETVFPVASPTSSPAYPFSFDFLRKTVNIARYDLPLAAINPSSWTYFGTASFDLQLNTWYWAKCYILDGELKVKVWLDGADEPEAWLIETSDPNARLTGKFHAFALFGPPPGPSGGDIARVDDVTIRGFEPLSVEPIPGEIPTSLQLEQNYPNPFNPETSIRFQLARDSEVRLEVFSITGQRVRSLISSKLPAGAYRITFDGRDDAGRPLASGLYLYKLRSNHEVVSKKMLIVR